MCIAAEADRICFINRRGFVFKYKGNVEEGMLDLGYDENLESWFSHAQ